MIDKVILGENCLLEYQLYRTTILNQPHGCFDSMILNLDAVTKIIKDDFSGLLHKSNLAFLNFMYYPDLVLTKWINNKYSGDRDNIYSWPICSLYHLDNMQNNEIITNKGLDSFQRKINRTKARFESDNETMLFYYYRYSERYNIARMKEKLLEFRDFVESKYNKK